MFDVNDNLSYNRNTYNRMTMIDNCLRVTMINYIWNNTKIYLTKLISRIKRNKNEQTSKSYKIINFNK